MAGQRMCCVAVCQCLQAGGPDTAGLQVPYGLKQGLPAGLTSVRLGAMDQSVASQGR